ncbi:MAG: potassium channel family protein [Aquincola sp.]|nr:potassium channel family protein [Aquincola sp.]MDH5330973.1 potassium channel family protein [Aquincola sp.]
MLIVLVVCVVVVFLTTVFHYEVLGTLNERLPSMRIPNRSKLLIVMFVMLIAHLLEMALWALAMYGLVEVPGVGTLRGVSPVTFESWMYFSAETYTSLGFGDVTPSGHMRLLIGLEALNGLLLIAWSASFTYLSMERFWSIRRGAQHP